MRATGLVAFLIPHVSGRANAPVSGRANAWQIPATLLSYFLDSMWQKALYYKKNGGIPTMPTW